ncbi:MAG: ABC transporter ATP-binding protein [Myxococcales bacterium]
MIHVQNLSKQFGDKVLFDDLCWHVKPGQRIGLVGPNGAGKTTLFRVVAGELSPDAGTVTRAKRLELGLLEQEVDPFGEATVLEEALEAFAEIRAMGHEIRAIQGRLEVQSDDALLERLGSLQEAFERQGGYELEARAKKVLSGLGFSDGDMGRPAREFSGGFMMRIALARLLLRKPDLMMLDEPTNHLDLESLAWFEQFLAEYEGTIIVISHDRWFLNRVVDHIAELANGQVTVYVGNYDAYLRQRQERREQLEKAAARQERQIAETERFIERFRAKATKAKAVQSRVRQLEKVERIEVGSDARTMGAFRFPQPPRSGRVVAELSGVVKRYGDVEVYRGLDLLLEREERVALLGPNGAGKSTLLKVLAGRLPIDAGTRTIGHNVTVSYFAQHQVELLDPRKTVLEEMDAAADYDTTPLVRGLLGRFLFSGKDVDKPVAVLSGGEKSRLALAKMLLNPANLLLLDEPTNHLDVAARESLEQALREFTGTICFISHDRYFIQAVANKVVEVGGGKAEITPGTYDYYLWKKAQEAAPEAQAPGVVAPGPRTRKDVKRIEAELRNVFYRETRRQRDRLAAVEQEVATAEHRTAELTAETEADGFFTDPKRMERVYAEQRELQRRLEALYAEWEALGSELEAAEAQFREELAVATA